MPLNFLNTGYFADKVGIGTVTPSSKLTVSGPATPSLSNGENSIRIERHASAGASPGVIGNGINFAQKWWSGSASLQVTGGIYGIKNASNGTYGGGLAFYTQPSSAADMAQRMVIDTLGNVGINTTSPPVKFVVNNGVARTNTAKTYSTFVHTNDTDDFRVGLATAIKGGAASANRYISIEGASYQVSTDTFTNEDIDLVLNPVAGNIGIGTTGPIHKLYVNGDIGQTDGHRIWFRGSSSSSAVGAQSYIYSNGLNLQIKGDDNVQLLGDGGGIIAHFDYTGKVGIGTTLPDFKLDVDGTFGVSDLPFNTTSVSVLVANETLGAEIITNGDFNTDLTDWTNSSSFPWTSATHTASGTRLQTSGSAQYKSFFQNIGAITAGKKYKISYSAVKTSGTMRVGIETSPVGSTLGYNKAYTSSVVVDEVFTATVTDTTAVISFWAQNDSSTIDWVIDNVSLKEITSASDQIQKRELGTGAFGPTPVGAFLPINNPTFTGVLTGPSADLEFIKLTAANPGILMKETDVTDKNWDIQLNGGNLKFYEVNDARSVFNEKVTFKAGGNVGIATTDPSAKLEVSGSNSLLFLNSSGNSYSIIDRSASNRRSALVFSTAGTGTTIPDNINWAIGVADSDEVGDGTGFFIGSSTTATSSKLFINSSGNVGIGTTSPGANLEIGDGTANVTMKMFGASTANINIRTGAGAGTSIAYLGQYFGDEGSLYLDKTGVNKVLLRAAGDSYFNGGNVGINVTNPSEKLDVDGNVRVRSLTAGIVTSSATGVLSTGGPTPLNSSLGEGYAANIREKYYRTNRTVYPSTIGSQYAQLIQQGVLDDMSLIMSPIATKVGEVSSSLPSNDLGDFTFIRDNPATRINSEGHIEGEIENYFTRSNSFDNPSSWTLGLATVTGAQADYFGKGTAWKLQDTASTGQHFVRQTPGVGGIVNVSIYAKAGTKSFLFIRGVEAIPGAVSQEAFFNLSTGLLGNTSEAITAYMEPVGNGFYRCSASFDHIPSFEYYFGVANADNVVAYTGDGTGNIYILNSQLESGIGANEYNATGSNGNIFLGGVTNNIPRIDYLNKIPELLLELTSTNVCYDGARPLLSNTTLTPCISPAGINDGIRITEVANTGQHYAFFNANVANNTQYYFSIYIKKGTESQVTMYTQSNTISSSVTVNLDNGTAAFGGGTNGAVIDAGNGWYRVSYLTPTSVAASTSMDIYITVIDLGSRAGDASKFTDYYGPQLETCITQGGPSSLIPTFERNTTGITRPDEAIEVSGMSRNNIATGANSGTLMLDFSNYYSSAGDSLQWTQSSSIISRGYFYVRQFGFADTWGGGGTATVDGVNAKLIWRLNTLTSGTFFKDGTKLGTVTGTAWANIDKIKIISNFGYMRIRNIFMASTALTDDQCVNLTTINE